MVEGSHDLVELAATLTNQPDRTAVKSAINALGSADLDRPSSGLLAVYSALLQLVIEYADSELEFASAFRNLPGIASLISRIAVLIKSESLLEAEFLANFLVQVLAVPDIVLRIWRVNRSEATAIFAGSRLFSTVTMLNGNFWFCSGVKYSQWLADQLLQLSELPPSLLDKSAKLGYAADFVGKFFPQHFAEFKTAFKAMRLAQQEYILSKGLFPFLETISVGSAAAILHALDTKPDLIFMSLHHGLHIQRAVVCACQQIKEATLKLLARWGDRTFLQTLDMYEQQAQTQVLIGLARKMLPSDAVAIMSSIVFITAVQNRLESMSNRAHQMATIVGDELSKAAKDKLMFEVPNSDEWYFGVDEIASLDQALTMAEPEPVILEQPVHAESDEDGADSDDEDGEEEISVPPVYLKDLIEYLRADSYAKHQSALVHGSSLVLRKAQFGSEVSHYAKEILTLVAGLGDRYNLPNFSRLRQDLLTSVLVAVPAQAPVVVRLFGTGDFSLYQRISLLTCMVLAAQQLSSYVNVQPVSQQLPIAQHEAFKTDLDQMVFEVQDKLMIDTKQVMEDKLGPAKVLRISKELSKPSKAGPRQVNRYSKLAANWFVFPLAAQNVKGCGSYTPLLTAHYLKTLALLVYYAYPSNDMSDMVREVLAHVTQQSSTEPVVLEAIYTAILALCDVAGSLLVQQHSSKIGDIYDWAQANWNQIPDPKTQKLGAAVVLKLGQLLQDMQNTFSAF